MVVEEPSSILDDCIVYWKPDLPGVSYKWTSDEPALEAAIHAMVAGTREGRSLSDYVNLSDFGPNTQAKLWEMWNEAKALWRQYEQQNSTTSSSTTSSNTLSEDNSSILFWISLIAVVIGVSCFINGLQTFNSIPSWLWGLDGRPDPYLMMLIGAGLCMGFGPELWKRM